MGSHFDASYLSAHPCYPNSVAWSDENLLAVATGHIVTILNPSSLSGPRGLITVHSKPPFQIGFVEKQDLLTPCLLPTCLLRDVHPCVRSISWSHQGLAPNSGCLLAVCTVDGCVKLYRAPFCDFRAEWIEVLDISDKLYGYFLDNNFVERDNGSTPYFHKIEGHHTTASATTVAKEYGSKKKLKHKITKKSVVKVDSMVVRCEPTNGMKEKPVLDGDAVNNQLEASRSSATVYGESILIPCLFSEGASVEVLKHRSSQKFWLNGKVLRVEEGKVFVRFTEDNAEEYDEWFALNLEPAMGEEEALLWKIRPTLNLGSLPNEIYLAERNEEMEQVLMKGQAVETWLDHRWTEGVFLGFNGGGLLIDFPGDCGCVTLMPDNVRLMPKWVPDQRSWQITVVKMNIMETAVRHVHQDEHKEGSKEQQEENGFQTSVSAAQYAYRNNLLQSLVVSWSPALHLSAEVGATPMSGSSKTCALLAVGGKSGKISFWRFNEPQCYTVDHCPVSIDTILVGLLQAHGSWVTAISWVILECTSKFVLATGSCEGCVKLWLGDIEGVVTSKEVNDDCLCLLREVVTVTAIPISVISCILPSKIHDEILVAVGKGSGSLEVVSCAISSREVKFAGELHAHDQVVTGLSWAFGGCCLYSCSQDNSVRCWRLQLNSISLVAFPLSSLALAYGRKTANEIPRHIFDSCFGLALSPGSLVLALVHDIDIGLVDPMYESRSQKAAIELIWTGGMVKVSKDIQLGVYCEPIPGFSESDLVCWGSSILWSLEQFEHPAKPLVLWDILEALLAFKQVEPKYVETILYEWLSISWTDSGSAASLENILSSAPSEICKLNSRYIHMAIIICRRLVLYPLKMNTSNLGRNEPGFLNDEALNLWSNLLTSGEAELRRRLVALTFSAVLSLASGAASALPLDRPCWFPTGVAQMQQWAVLNYNLIPDDLRLLKMEVDRLGKRLYSVCEYVSEEKCNFCSSSVPFEYPEMAVCDGSECDNVVGEKHKLLRCVASMQVCDTAPSWFCICCKRYVYKLAPATLFMGTSSQYFSHVTSSTFSRTYPKPCCPFCGVLLQRLQPEFLLSASVV